MSKRMIAVAAGAVSIAGGLLAVAPAQASPIPPTDGLSWCYRGACENEDKLGNYVCTSYPWDTDTPVHGWACDTAMQYVREHNPQPIGRWVSPLITLMNRY